MTTNDHIVPQMYLRRFAQQRRKQHVLRAKPLGPLEGSKTFTANVRNVAVRRGYNWGVTDDGVPHHDVEALFGTIESGASHAFRAMLDDPHHALPRRWPMSKVDRKCMAWWLAAQLLRTNRQRRRLASLGGEGLPPPGNVRSYVENNRHLEYVARWLGTVAAVMHDRPWCLGFSDACLLTSDVPLLVLNGQDDTDQALSASFWDVVLPLDPHRFLMLPGAGSVKDPAKRSDHLAKFDGGLGRFVNQAIYDAADEHIFFHPDHADALSWTETSARLPSPEADTTGAHEHGYVLSYRALPTGYTVDRRWVSDHPSPG